MVCDSNVTGQSIEDRDAIPQSTKLSASMRRSTESRSQDQASIGMEASVAEIGDLRFIGAPLIPLCCMTVIEHPVCI